MVLSSQLTYKIGEVNIGTHTLTSGEKLEEVTCRYELVGPAGAPVILVCHALTGNHQTVGTAENPGWWSGLIGSNKYIDTKNYQVLTFNVLGGCNGTTGPASLNPTTNEPYRMTFPQISVQDMVHVQYRALNQLKITALHAIIGGSLGGMQVMEFGLLYPTLMKKLVILASTPAFSDYGIAFNHIAASAIKQDPNWNHGDYSTNQWIQGLEIARMVGMVTYRSSDLFTERFHRKQSGDDFSVISYLDYQGKKLTRRFDANSYLYLLQAMNTHDICAERGNLEQVSRLFSCPILAISYEKDLIYEPEKIQAFAEKIPNCTFHHVETIFGHDGFLTEYEKWGNVITNFIN